jgi:hypothetical protein
MKFKLRWTAFQQNESEERNNVQAREGRLRPPFLRRIILIQPTRCKLFGPASIGAVGSHESLPLPPLRHASRSKWGRGGGGFRAALLSADVVPMAN